MIRKEEWDFLTFNVFVKKWKTYSMSCTETVRSDWRIDFWRDSTLNWQETDSNFIILFRFFCFWKSVEWKVDIEGIFFIHGRRILEIHIPNESNTIEVRSTLCCWTLSCLSASKYFYNAKKILSALLWMEVKRKKRR